MLFYEEARSGNGLHAYYFDNPLFEGDPEKTLVESIDFKWLA
jgi:hypothetical protein